jgi:hypothetical protein
VISVARGRRHAGRMGARELVGGRPLARRCLRPSGQPVHRIPPRRDLDAAGRVAGLDGNPSRTPSGAFGAEFTYSNVGGEPVTQAGLCWVMRPGR